MNRTLTINEACRGNPTSGSVIEAKSSAGFGHLLAAARIMYQQPGWANREVGVFGDREVADRLPVDKTLPDLLDPDRLSFGRVKQVAGLQVL